MKRALVLGAIILVAFVLRLYALDSQSLWYDEAVTAHVAGQGVAELTRWTASDIQPPLYYYFVSGWTRLAGNGEWALRFPSAFFSTLTVALLFCVARSFTGERSGLIVAALSALSPFYVYYAQEARMYALLTFLGLLAGYTLARAWTSRQGGAVWWLAFVLASAAALYTHYLAAFLLGAYLLCALLARGGKRRLATLAAAVVTIGVLYLPWLPAMLATYRVDASYWQGALKLDEALRHLAISFVAGAPDTMLEGDATRWAVWVAAALILSVVGLLVDRRARSAAILAVLLVVPVLGVLLLASRTPKFNSRYLMMASPAYLLLLAGGIAALWQRARGFWRATAVLALAVVLAPSLLGLWNWFRVPSFTKAQWREAAAHVRDHMGADDGIVLVSGHATPAWEYYAPGVDPIRLPPMDVLDVTKVLGFRDAAELGAGLAGKRGVWLVTWQDDVADPLGVVPFLLDRAGEEQLVSEGFWHLGLRHWRLREDATFESAPEPQHVAAANFDHKLALQGWDEPANGQITVYWRALNTLLEDYQVSLILEDDGERELGRWDGRPAAYGYPTTRWQPGEVVFGRYPLSLPAGAELFVSLAVYSAGSPDGLDIRDVADNPSGKRVRLGPLATHK